MNSNWQVSAQIQARKRRMREAAPEMHQLLTELRSRVSLHPPDIDERIAALLARIDGEGT